MRVMMRPSPSETPRSTNPTAGQCPHPGPLRIPTPQSATMGGFVVSSVMHAAATPATPGSSRLSLLTGSVHSSNSTPGYFGLVVDSAEDSTMRSRPSGNWSPPGSSIQSAAVRSPMPVAGDSLPVSEEFQRQAAALAQSMSRPNLSNNTSFSSVQTERDVKMKSVSPLSSPTKRDDGSDVAMPMQNLLNGQLGSTATASTFNLPSDVPSFNLSLPTRGPVSGMGRVPNMKLVPVANGVPNEDVSGITGERLVELLDTEESSLLVLDVRSYAAYSLGRIRNAVNLCIPTTLLKRPSWTASKLAESITAGSSRDRFAKWKTAKYIVVYDADPQSVSYPISKFTREGWKGKAYYLQGGFAEFSLKFADKVDTQPVRSEAAKSSLALNPVGSSVPTAPPTLGINFNCPLPISTTAVNPFFSNIRQNMDLIGGVGEFPISIPDALDEKAVQTLPNWLRRICEKDGPKLVAEKFRDIEVAEQKRMQNALSNPDPQSGADRHVLAGIEKGTKNRYNNIWPYDHARVKLQDYSHDAGDYINASHIWAKHSAKRYIATQGPLPATFQDFWSLVWEQDVRVIVMLTAEFEAGQVKCDSYWTQSEYGPIKLAKLDERRVSLEPSHGPYDLKRRSTETNVKSPTDSDIPYVTVRKFSLSHCSHPFQPIREITQLQYSNWPDFGTPAHPAHILGLIEHTDAVVRASAPVRPTFSGAPLSMFPSQSASQRPILVHCSAGCGRTGTFCAIDSVIGMLRRQRFHKQFGYSKPQNENVETLESPTSVRPATPVSASPLSPTSAAQPAEKEDQSWLDKDDVDLIYQVVEDFRDQRLSMVQSLRQFVLCYETVLEWLSRQKPLDSSKRKR